MAIIASQIIDTTKFPCNRCGICCQYVDLAEETRFLDRGDGVCLHYNGADKVCNIYANRPDICRVDLQYLLHYRHLHSWNEFIVLNMQACRQLSEAHAIKFST